MSTHPDITTGSSQCACILAELECAPGEWVSLARLHICSGSMAVHSRIADLRRRGHVIEQENRRKPHSRIIHSFYRLKPESRNQNPESRPESPTPTTATPVGTGMSRLPTP